MGHKMKKPVRNGPLTLTLALTLALALPALSGCSFVPSEQGVNGFQFSDKRWLSVQESSHSAADRLIKQAEEHGFLKPGIPLVSTTLTDVNHVGKSSGLGRIVADQVGARFTQKGYPVTEIRLRNAVNITQDDKKPSIGGEYMLSRDTAELVRKAKAAGILTGTYAIGKDSVFISLRLVAVTTGKVVSAYNYALFMNDDVKALTHNDDDRMQASFFNLEQ